MKIDETQLVSLVERVRETGSLRVEGVDWVKEGFGGRLGASVTSFVLRGRSMASLHLLSGLVESSPLNVL